MNATTVQEAEVLEMQPAAHHPAPVVQQAREVTAAAASATPAQLLQMAVQQGADLDRLERLMALQERWEANEARKAYTLAMAEFKKNPPQIIKNKEAGFVNGKGQRVEYTYANLGGVVRAIVGALAEHGISHAWRTDQLEGGLIEVTCTLTHALGHSESVSLRTARDDSGSKNNIQAVASAITYLERYTLLAATGLATDDQDDDGASAERQAGAEVQAELIAQEILNRLLTDLSKCLDDNAAKALWDTGSKSLAATKSRDAYERFKAAVVAKRLAIKEGGAV